MLSVIIETLVPMMIAYLSLGVIFTIAIAYKELSDDVVELDTIPNIMFSVIKIITLWLPIIIIKYIWN